MSVQKISNEDLVHFLKVSPNAVADMRGSDWYWVIDGVAYPEQRAVKLAEYCMITGQNLTSFATIEGALNLARRTAAAEEEITNLNLAITDMKRRWWRRG